ncbi:Putative S-adenosyl-L-methionine-dependent methyltransferase [Mycobacterium talmoniae]|uniref:S-adenosyl-L-methionine-dependent methyltransferase n=1 Tax=Mycobacterium talmoniae TaxID=1858794 RepID=A0A2S8BH38_9MYCO|nr:Putative S-adenosyl-L-methionine-dependent methyltransferase [Mycobacterium talmoniae]
MAQDMTDLDEVRSVRTDGDSWEITECVGATALSVAACRAAETAQPQPLIRDEFAYLLVSKAGEAWRGWPAAAWTGSTTTTSTGVG